VQKICWRRKLEVKHNKKGADMGRVVHFEIQADDPERAIDFYATCFGWQFTKWDGPVDYWLITTGPDDQPGINGGLMRREAPLSGQGFGSFACTIDIINIDETIAIVTQHGGAVTKDKMAVPGVGWMAYVKDTEGNVFGVMQADSSAA
jgi:predicted enzyme related to lactoylglutathione lyase